MTQTLYLEYNVYTVYYTVTVLLQWLWWLDTGDCKVYNLIYNIKFKYLNCYHHVDYLAKQ